MVVTNWHNLPPVRRNLLRRGLRRALRRGVTSIIAMMYLVLISTLAVGFYAVMTTSSQMSHNDEHTAHAYLAAESGMDFIRRQLAKVTVPPNIGGAAAIDYYYADLQTMLNGTGNMDGHTIGRFENTVTIPSDGYIKLDPAGHAKVRATLTDWNGEVVAKIEGFYGTASVARTITMDFTRDQLSSNVFDFAVASRGGILMKKGSVSTAPGVDSLIAKMLSAKESGLGITMTGGEIGGDLTIMETAGVSITGGTVAGSSILSNILDEHVHSIDEAPEFPTIDPTVYKRYATNSWVDKQKVQKNILVPAGKNPTFNSNDTVQGIMYIESPNVVTFNGDFKLQGFIVMETSGATTDKLLFKGNLTQSPVPNAKEFDTLRSTSGVAILAPEAAVEMTGSVDSHLKGSVIVNTFHFRGSADIQIDLGTLMTLSPNDNSAIFEGKNVRFTGTGSSNIPSEGLTYSQYYMAKPSTYQEPLP